MTTNLQAATTESMVSDSTLAQLRGDQVAAFFVIDEQERASLVCAAEASPIFTWDDSATAIVGEMPDIYELLRRSQTAFAVVEHTPTSVPSATYVGFAALLAVGMAVCIVAFFVLPATISPVYSLLGVLGCSVLLAVLWTYAKTESESAGFGDG